MNDKELSSLLKYSSPRELYIVTWNNLLKVLFCPFKVTVLNKVGQLKKGQIVLVEEVKITNDLKTVYIIKGVAYYYYHFDILSE
ncbi:hypothetical protein [Gelidibacter maritimus]|uniref:Uncharacterized protein n=1 Tax=Gelidibacter maritimus TaxID=2761487 RepID=A0A7W2M762_9FLAO|nr:hypothetical protein [Gelidibacter maritimus]MBA6153945.1 hypothetical protein [Gelidibacter maritimus]